MGHTFSAGRRFCDALAIENPLQVVGTINAYSALMAECVGFRSIYLSGGGVANASYGLPDIGMTTLNDVLEDVRRRCTYRRSGASEALWSPPQQRDSCHCRPV